ncbi:hypothetical protein ID858_02240 [Xenorhabdus sp. DI]|nr:MULTISPECIES: hypothetical protein [unclassified Xenorhabdus]MBD2785176.1 hypothetical protein [Xenorhabdus sp. 3]MBD2787331.1 hypothetical protein [Xenorhabdus sp. DI]
MDKLVKKTGNVDIFCLPIVYQTGGVRAASWRMSGSDMIIKENGWIGGDERDITDSTTPRQGMGLLL